MNISSRLFLFIIILITNVAELLSYNYFVFNTSDGYFNRKVFVRNHEQIYYCPDEKGWINLSTEINPVLKIINENRSLVINSNSDVGIFQMYCGNNAMEVLIIDKYQFDITISPNLPEFFYRDTTYIFEIIFQPDVINKDRTYLWHVYQISGRDKIKFVEDNNLLVMYINASMKEGEYSIGIKTEYDTVKNFSFVIANIQKKHRSAVYFPLPKKYVMGPLTGVRSFIITFLCFGLLVISIGTIVYVVSLFGKRSENMLLPGHTDVNLEETTMIDKKLLKGYKIMKNPMNREKDVELILKMFKDVKSRNKNSLKRVPYELAPEEISVLRSKFPRGVCLNCVKFACQLIIGDKTRCPFIMHTCHIPAGENFEGVIDCVCLVPKMNEIKKQLDLSYVPKSCLMYNTNNIYGLRELEIKTDFENDHIFTEIKNSPLKTMHNYIKLIKAFSRKCNKTLDSNENGAYFPTLRDEYFESEEKSLIDCNSYSLCYEGKKFNSKLIQKFQNKSNEASPPNVYYKKVVPSVTSSSINEKFRHFIANPFESTIYSVKLDDKPKFRCQQLDWCLLDKEKFECPKCTFEAIKKMMHLESNDDSSRYQDRWLNEISLGQNMDARKKCQEYLQTSKNSTNIMKEYAMIFKTSESKCTEFDYSELQFDPVQISIPESSHLYRKNSSSDNFDGNDMTAFEDLKNETEKEQKDHSDRISLNKPLPYKMENENVLRQFKKFDKDIESEQKISIFKPKKILDGAVTLDVVVRTGEKKIKRCCCCHHHTCQNVIPEMQFLHICNHPSPNCNCGQNLTHKNSLNQDK